MRFSFQGVPVDMARAESSRFRHPLLLLHGLWAGSWVWRGFMGYLAHRGWDSWAPSFLEAEADPSVGRVETLLALCRTLPSAPVIVGHDAGARLTVRLAADVGAPAMVAITPLLTRRDAPRPGLLAWPRFWRARLFGTGLRPPGGRARALYCDHPDMLRADSASLFRELASGSLGRPAASALIVGSSGDAITSASDLERLAHERGWAFLRHASGGHFPMVEPGWERLADDLHRWLVQAIGEQLLAFVDEEE
jgi:pimeloyl-ACP methyl ester carboxylesterase